MNYVNDMPDRLEEPTIFFCDVCGGDIYEGDQVYQIDGEIICTGSGCLEEHFVYTIKTVYKGGF